jgi:hypothetical protein
LGPPARAGLAERVAAALLALDADEPPSQDGPLAHHAAGVERHTPTPTAPMLVSRPAPTLVEPTDDGPIAVTPPRPPRVSNLGLTLTVVGAVIIVGLAGLRLARPRHATLSLASPLPKRTLVEVDGKPTLAPDVGGTLNLPPGRHLITLVLPRNDRRDYSIDVRAGDRVLVFPLLRGSAGAAYEGRDP